MGWFNFFQNDEQDARPLPLTQRDDFRRNVIRILAVAGILIFIALAVAAMVIGTNANAAPPTSWSPDDQVPENGTCAVLFVTVGASSSDKSVRGLGYGLPSKGWYDSGLDKNIATCAAEFNKRGIPFRILLHNPWGQDGTGPMDFDQRIEAAENPKLDLVIKSFPPWLESRLKPLLGDNGELIIYLGALDVDPDFVKLKSNPKAYRERVADSLVDVPDWASIAFDHSGSLKADSIEWSVMLHEKAGGRRIYCEARPHAGSAVLGLPVVCDGRFWWRSDPQLFPKDSGKWAAKNADMKGAEILAMTVQGSDADRRTRLVDSMDKGLTPLFDGRDLWVLDYKRGVTQ